MSYDKNLTITEIVDGWTVSKTIDDEKIKSMTKELLSHPSATIELGEQKQVFYTMDSMLQMFKTGFSAARKMDIKKELFYSDTAEMQPKPYTILRSMNINEKITLPFSAWKATRVAASVIKKHFNSEFTVRKLGPYREEGDIEVTRIA